MEFDKKTVTSVDEEERLGVSIGERLRASVSPEEVQARVEELGAQVEAGERPTAGLLQSLSQLLLDFAHAAGALGQRVREAMLALLAQLHAALARVLG